MHQIMLAYDAEKFRKSPFSGTKGLLGRTHRQRRASADAGPVHGPLHEDARTRSGQTLH